jgi:hypothetical protein
MTLAHIGGVPVEEGVLALAPSAMAFLYVAAGLIRSACARSGARASPRRSPPPR